MSEIPTRRETGEAPIHATGVGAGCRRSRFPAGAADGAYEWLKACGDGFGSDATRLPGAAQRPKLTVGLAPLVGQAGVSATQYNSRARRLPSPAFPL